MERAPKEPAKASITAVNSDLRIVASKKKWCRNGLRPLSPPRLNFAATINDFSTPNQCCPPNAACGGDESQFPHVHL